MPASREPLFSGNFLHTLDVKKRLTVPAKWRFEGDEEECMLLIPHPDAYLLALPPREVEHLRAKIAAVRFGDSAAQNFYARLLGISHAYGMDKQGRFVVPDALLAHAGIRKEARFVGNLTTYKIYAPEAWEAINAQNAGEGLRELMAQTGF